MYINSACAEIKRYFEVRTPGASIRIDTFMYIQFKHSLFTASIVNCILNGYPHFSVRIYCPNSIRPRYLSFTKWIISDKVLLCETIRCILNYQRSMFIIHHMILKMNKSVNHSTHPFL